MKVYFCLRSDHKIYSQVLPSLEKQTVPCEVVEVKTVGGKENTHRTYSPARQLSEAACRKIIFEMAVKEPDEFFCVSDWDIEHLITTNIADALAAMTDETIGAVSIMPRTCSLNIGFVVYRKSAVEKSDYANLKNKYGFCMCREVTELIKNAGYKFVYLNNRKHIREH